MNFHLFPNKKTISLSAILFLFTIIISTMFCQKSSKFKFPTYPTAKNISFYSLERGSKGITYFVKLKYPEEVDAVYNFYKGLLIRSGWETSGTEEPKWNSFIDITHIKVNYLSARWEIKETKEGIILTLRYEIDPNKETIIKNIEQSISMVNFSLNVRGKMNIWQKIGGSITGLFRKKEKVKHISEIRNSISFHLGEDMPFSREKNEGYREVEFIPFGSKNKDEFTWLIQEKPVLTEKYIEYIKLAKSETLPDKYAIVARQNEY